MSDKISRCQSRVLFKQQTVQLKRRAYIFPFIFVYFSMESNHQIKLKLKRICQIFVVDSLLVCFQTNTDYLINK